MTSYTSFNTIIMFVAFFPGVNTLPYKSQKANELNGMIFAAISVKKKGV